MAFPADDELRYAGVELRVARLQAELDAKLATTRRGRLALSIVRWITRRRQA
jgi:hypothetical protein